LILYTNKTQNRKSGFFISTNKYVRGSRVIFNINHVAQYTFHDLLCWAILKLVRLVKLEAKPSIEASHSRAMAKREAEVLTKKLGKPAGLNSSKAHKISGFLS